jgi:antitoxin CptB|tara:strand:+ start:390 stop:647 length:258 start_codon:yes stop_codon:yes gene_type:complete
MNEINNLKKKIIYRSEYRGTKEMDLLLGNFVKKYINIFSINDLHDLCKLLDISDEDLTKCILNKDPSIKLPNNNVVNLLKDFKID